jgi:hypothetical protein
VARRVLAALLLLVTVVFVHAATPHHMSAPALLIAEVKPQVHEEPPAKHDAMADQAHHPANLHGGHCAPLTLRRRGQMNVMAIPGGGGWQTAVQAPHGEATVSLLATARDRRDPTGGTAPTPSALQTFRC